MSNYCVYASSSVSSNLLFLVSEGVYLSHTPTSTKLLAYSINRIFDPNTSPDVAIVDSGTSERYTPLNVPCSNKQPCHTPYTVTLPDQREICATHTASLDLPRLPPSAFKAYLFEELTDRVLVSATQFYDNGYNVVFAKNSVLILSREKIILAGVRSWPKGMSFINLKPHRPVPSSLVLSSNNHDVLNYAHNIKSTKNLIKFYHRCCYLPVISTWKAAIRKSFFATWHGLTCADVDKYLDRV